MLTVKQNRHEDESSTLSPEVLESSLASILLADDDEINRQIVQHVLSEESGFKVTVAEDGREALKACITKQFDLLIVDYKMPGISGDRVIRHLRASANPNTLTPAVLFSAATRQELGPVVSACGANDVVSKPIKSAEFLSAIRKLLADAAKD